MPDIKRFKVTVHLSGADKPPDMVRDAVVAHTPLEAAEHVLGTKLTTKGTSEKLRALVVDRDGREWDF
jgi:hypothetical protein